MNNTALMQFLPIVLIIAVFYFFILRPQQKRHKERAELLNSLKKGDGVITIGGLHGTIVDLTEEKATIKVGDNSRLVFERSAINTISSSDDSSAEGSTQS